MDNVNKLTHSTWDCSDFSPQYHIVWIPKCRRKKLYGEIGKYLGDIFHELAGHRESKILEGHVCPDHIHMLIAIPPKYSIASVVGYIKGKSAIAIARTYLGRRANFTGQNFWARGYYVSTVGRDEETIRKYIKEQEDEDNRLDQLDMFKDN